MSITDVPKGAVNPGYGAFYLPAITFGFLFLEDWGFESGRLLTVDFQLSYLTLMGLLLGAGIVSHEFLKSLSGPTHSEPSPISKSTAVQRIGFTVFGEGKPTDYPTDPTTPIWRANTDIPRRKYGNFAIIVLSGVILIGGYLYGMIRLFDYTTLEGSMLGGGILFLQVVFIARLLIPDIFPNTYLMNHRTAPTVKHKMEAFTQFLRLEENMYVRDLEYTSSDGGLVTVEYETAATSGKHERENLESIFVGYAGTFSQEDFPCGRLAIRILEEGQPTATFEIDTSLIDAFQTRQIGMGELLDIVLDQIEFDV